MAGVAMTTTILGQPLVDSPAAQLFIELDRRGTVLYLHPTGNAACTSLISEHHGTWSVGAPVEDTISLLHLITYGIPSRFPRMKILNSHLGVRCRCSCSGRPRALLQRRGAVRPTGSVTSCLRRAAGLAAGARRAVPRSSRRSWLPS